MPIPSKKVGEKQSEYMVRCVPQMMMYHDRQQAIAICYRTFQGKMINLETYMIILLVHLTMLKRFLDGGISTEMR